MIIINCLLYLIGTTGNIILIFVFYRCRKLRTRINSLIIHLSLISAVRSSFIIYSKIVTLSSGSKHINPNICNMIGMIQVSTSIQSFAILSILSFLRSTKDKNERSLAGQFSKDRFTFYHFSIVFVASMIATFGLGKYFFNDSRSICGIEFAPQHPLFEKFYIVTLMSFIIIILFFYCKVLRGMLKHSSVTYPAVFELENGGISDVITRGDSSAEIPREKGTVSNGVTSNCNTRSTGLGSSNNSTEKTSKLEYFKYGSTLSTDGKRSSLNSIAISGEDDDRKERINARQTCNNDGDSLQSSRDIPNEPIHRNWRAQSAIYRDPNSFDSETENGMSRSDGNVLFSAFPTILDSHQESFCLEVEDLRTGKRYRTNDLEQTSQISLCESDDEPGSNEESKVANIRFYKNHENILCLKSKTDSKRICFNEQLSRNHSCASIQGMSYDNEAPQQRHDKKMLRNFILRRFFGKEKKVAMQSRVFPRQKELTKVEKCIIPNYHAGKYENDNVTSHDSTTGIEENKKNVKRNPLSDVCSSQNGSSFVLRNFTFEKSNRRDLFAVEKNNPVEVIGGNGSVKENASNVDDLQSKRCAVSNEDMSTTDCSLKPSIVLNRYLAHEKRLTIILFGISIGYILLKMPLIFIVILSIAQSWETSKTVTMIVDTIHDLTVCLIPMLYGCLCREFRHAILRFFTKRTQLN